MASGDFTAAHLRTLLHYDPLTGIFTWFRPRGRAANKATAGSMCKGYTMIHVNGKNYGAHRLAWLYVTGEWPTQDIDHRDTNKNNNRFANLRDESKTFNMQNQRVAHTRNKTGLLGASLHKNSGLYCSRIQVNGVTKRLGYFKTPEEAHQRYIKAKRELHPGCTI